MRKDVENRLSKKSGCHKTLRTIHFYGVGEPVGIEGRQANKYGFNGVGACEKKLLCTGVTQNKYYLYRCMIASVIVQNFYQTDSKINSVFKALKIKISPSLHYILQALYQILTPSSPIKNERSLM